MNNQPEKLVISVHFSDLLEKARGSGVHIAPLCDGEQFTDNPVLYRADRNVQVQRTGIGEFWHADHVHYSAGSMPNGEPIRSIGHWNRADQAEIFQVTSGRVVMVVVLPESPHTVFMATYHPGEWCVMPFGVYHITYSPWVESSVFNISCESAPAAGDKYARRPAPDVLLTMKAGTISVEAPPHTTVSTAPLSPALHSVPAGLEAFLPGADEAALRDLQTELAKLTAAGWPVGAVE